MASNFGQFAKRIVLRARGVGEHTEKAVRRAAVAADSALVMSTPVDTGRARGNWRTSVGSPNEEELDVQGTREQPNTQATQDALDEGVRVASGWRLGMGSIFITNSVPYIRRLDKGWSEQAPRGMTVHGIRAARKQLQGTKLLG